MTVAEGKVRNVPDQKRARVFGVLYLITFVTSIPALFLYEPALRHPVAFVAGAGNVNKIYFGALLELLLIIANIGTAVVIVPIMRRRFEDLSIGYVTARIFECTFILVGIVAMLGIATLHQEPAGAAEGTVAYTLAAIKDWTFLLGPGWIVGWGNGLILGYMMYRTGLVPRRMAWLGLVGGTLIIATGTAIIFTGNHPSSTLRALQGIATIPEFVWELFLGVYCTVLGVQARCPDPFQERDLTTQPSPTPHSPDAATGAHAPPWQRLMALSGVAFAPFFVIGWVTSVAKNPHYTASDQAWTNWAHDNQTKSRISAFAMLVAAFIFLYFIAAIRSALESCGVLGSRLRTTRPRRIRRCTNRHRRHDYGVHYDRRGEFRGCERKSRGE